MGSTKLDPSEWTALRVRETFLDYFKQNGHTFGALA
jgi:alanyl-tRNA synthetase